MGRKITVDEEHLRGLFDDVLAYLYNTAEFQDRAADACADFRRHLVDVLAETEPDIWQRRFEAVARALGDVYDAYYELRDKQGGGDGQDEGNDHTAAVRVYG